MILELFATAYLSNLAKQIKDYLADRAEPSEGKPVKFNKLSIVGYSLGGLWSRYVVGLLLQQNLLKVAGLSDGPLEPILFTTFATPHVGALYVGSNWHVPIFNYIGGSIVGQSGRDMFLQGSGDPENPRPVLEQMADPKGDYYKALASFKHRILYANAANDRTVPFFSAYIIGKDPFKVSEHGHIVYGKDPTIDGVDEAAKSAEQTISSKTADASSAQSVSSKNSDQALLRRKRRLTFPEIDTQQSKYVGDRQPSEDGSELEPISIAKNPRPSGEELRLLVTFCVIAPLLIPVFMAVSTVATMASDRRIRTLNSAAAISEAVHDAHQQERQEGDLDSNQNQIHRRSRRDSISDGVANITGAAMDDLLGPAHDDPSGTTTFDDADKERRGRTDNNDEADVTNSVSTSRLFGSEVPALELTPLVITLIENLNSLSWEKHVVRFHRRHSHAEIVNRRNFPGQGEDLIRSWVFNISSLV